MSLPTPSIADAPRSVDYTPNNSAGPFPVPFPVFEGTGDDLAVTLDGVPVTNWTFAGDQIEDFYGSPGCWVNGTITFDAPITGALRIVGRRRPRRVDQIAEGRGVPARDHNLELNRLTATQREIFDRVEDIAAATSDIIPEVAALKNQAQQAATDAGNAAAAAGEAADEAQQAAQLLTTQPLPDGTDFDSLDQRGTYVFTSELNAPLPGPTNRWVVEVVNDPVDADRVVQRAALLVGGAEVELASRRRMSGGGWEAWAVPAGSGRISVKDYGALGDGSTDDAAAIMAADAAAAAQGAALWFPSGTYMVGATLNVDRDNVVWTGEGASVCKIKRLASADLATLVHIGATTGTAARQTPIIRDIEFDGNGGCSEAVFKVRNVQRGVFERLCFTGGAAHGFKTETSTASINTNQLRNVYDNLTAYSNGGRGFYFIGEKDAQYGHLFAHNNAGDGIYFRAFKDDGNQLAETTTCVADTLLARDNGGSGIVFDGCEKYVVGVIDAAINGQFGIRFLSSDTGAASVASNNVNIAAATLRNNALGGIRHFDSAKLVDAVFGTVLIIGFNSLPNSEGIRLSGAVRVDFGVVKVIGQRGTACRILNGTPLGVATECQDITFGTLHLQANGDPASSANHGLSIEGAASGIHIGRLIAKNSETKTATSNYELNVSASAANITIDYADLKAVDFGREFNGSTVDFGMLKRGPVAPARFIRRTGLPGVLPGYAALSIQDNGSGTDTLQVRWDSGTSSTIATEP